VPAGAIPLFFGSAYRETGLEALLTGITTLPAQTFDSSPAAAEPSQKSPLDAILESLVFTHQGGAWLKAIYPTIHAHLYERGILYKLDHDARTLSVSTGPEGFWLSLQASDHLPQLLSGARSSRQTHSEYSISGRKIRSSCLHEKDERHPFYIILDAGYENDADLAIIQDLTRSILDGNARLAPGDQLALRSGV
jgi:hypothetical protein